MKQSFVRSIASLSVAVALVACGDTEPTQPNSSPLAGLNKTVSNDSVETSNPTTTSGPGYFRGTVLGPALPGAGNDSLKTAPKIAGVVVTIFERKMSGGADTVVVGDAKGS